MRACAFGVCERVFYRFAQAFVYMHVVPAQECAGRGALACNACNFASMLARSVVQSKLGTRPLRACVRESYMRESGVCVQGLQAMV